METRIDEYSVGQLARLSGISVRRLHHYDEIGLLKPAYVAPNGYRFYGRTELLRLQEILFYQGIGMSLTEVADFLKGNGDAVERLSAHRMVLASKAKGMAAMLKTLDHTIAHLKGERDMTYGELYQPFTAEKQAEYEAWLINTYGKDMANAVTKSKQENLDDSIGFPPERMAELKDIEARFVVAMNAGTTKAALKPLFDAHRDWISAMWNRPCTPDAYAGLADMYLAHPDFIARFETLAAGFSQWLSQGMKQYAADRTD